MAVDKKESDLIAIVKPNPLAAHGEGRKDAVSAKNDGDDKLVCGRCSAEFSLNDLQKFVQHKEEECISNIPLSLVRQIQQASAIRVRDNGIAEGVARIGNYLSNVTAVLINHSYKIKLIGFLEVKLQYSLPLSFLIGCFCSV